MSVTSWPLSVLVCVTLVGAGYLQWFRKAGTPPLWRWSVWGLALLLVVAEIYVRTPPRLFGEDSCLQNWRRRRHHEGGRWGEIQCERQYQRAQGQVLGDYLKSRVRGERCVILCAPSLLNLQREPLEDPTVAGLRDGLGEAFAEVVELEVPMAKGTDTPDDQVPVGLTQPMWTPAALEELLAKAGAFDLLVACVPLPEDCFGADGEIVTPSLHGKAVALCAGAWGNARKAVTGGGVLAAVGYAEPATCRETVCPPSPRKAFSQRYVLMTPDGDMTFSDSETED